MTPLENLLTNPKFASLHDQARPLPHYTAGWQTVPGDSLLAGQQIPGDDKKEAVILKPGGWLSQFIAFSDIPHVEKGEQLSLAVSGFQVTGSGLEATIALKGIESEGGKWTPASVGPFGDERSFYRHGRGELVNLEQASNTSSSAVGSFQVETDAITIDWFFKTEKEVQRSDYRNAVGIEVSFVNSGDQPLTLWHPMLTRSSVDSSQFAAGRPLPAINITASQPETKYGSPVPVTVLQSNGLMPKREELLKSGLMESCAGHNQRKIPLSTGTDNRTGWRTGVRWRISTMVRMNWKYVSSRVMSTSSEPPFIRSTLLLV